MRVFRAFGLRLTTNRLSLPRSRSMVAETSSEPTSVSIAGGYGLGLYALFQSFRAVFPEREERRLPYRGGFVGHDRGEDVHHLRPVGYSYVAGVAVDGVEKIRRRQPVTPFVGVGRPVGRSSGLPDSPFVESDSDTVLARGKAVPYLPVVNGVRAVLPDEGAQGGEPPCPPP